MELRVGTPLWRSPLVYGTRLTNTLCALPSATTSAHSIFAGVVVRDGEDSTHQMMLQTTGTALARVMGPVDAGDVVGQSAGHDYLEATETLPVGVAQQTIDAAEVVLIEVALGTGSGGSGAAVWQ